MLMPLITSHAADFAFQRFDAAALRRPAFALITHSPPCLIAAAPLIISPLFSIYFRRHAEPPGFACCLRL